MVLMVFASALAMVASTISLVPPPQNYLLDEYAWIKEDGTGPEAWRQHNDTGANMLELTYRHSSTNLAYVARTTGAATFNVTFIVFHNSSATSGFDSTGHLYPGSQANWTQLIPSQTGTPSGDYTYHLFVTTFDPKGVPGIYQVRINETGPGSGSNWSTPHGNPGVPWMFFRVPTAEPVVNVTDQLGRPQPFYIDGISPVTQLRAGIELEPPGNDTGVSQAVFDWLSPSGSLIISRSVPIQYASGSGWYAEDSLPANVTAFPANGTHNYTVRASMGPFAGTSSFQVLSGQWATVDINVHPTLGQWFDPSSFQVFFTTIINTGVPANPYQDVSNLTIQLFKDSLRGVVTNLSWNITGYPVVVDSSYTYSWMGMIPTSFIDPTGNGSQEFTGIYRLKVVPPPGRAALGTEVTFFVDDPLEVYTSLERSAVNARSAFEVNSTIWINIEMDPILLRNRQHVNIPFVNKQITVYWDWPSPPPDQIKTETVMAILNGSNPSNNYWAHAKLVTNESYPPGFYRIRVSAVCKTGYVVWDWKIIDIYRLRPPPPTETPNQPPYTRISPRSNTTLWHADIDWIKLYAADPPPGSGIAGIYHQVDDGPVSVYTMNVVQKVPPLEGSHIYTYWSEDRAGNAEMPRTATIRVDTIPPQTTIWPSPEGGPYESPIIIQLTATDHDPGSGVDKTYFAVDSSPPIEYMGGVLAVDGDHTYTSWSIDRAGNVEDTRRARVIVIDEIATLALILLCVPVFLRNRCPR